MKTDDNNDESGPNWTLYTVMTQKISNCMNANDLVIIVEHCCNCHEHVSTKHDLHKYVSKADETLRHLAETLHGMRLSIKCGVIRFPIESEKRIGAFEVRIICKNSFKGMSTLLHSKLESKKWPSLVNMEKKLKHFIVENDIPTSQYQYRNYSAMHLDQVSGKTYPAGYGPWRSTDLADPDWSYNGMVSDRTASSSPDTKAKLGHSKSDGFQYELHPKIWWVFNSQDSLGYRFDIGTMVRVKSLPIADNLNERNGLIAATAEYCDTAPRTQSTADSESGNTLKVQLKYNDGFCVVKEADCILASDYASPRGIPRKSDNQIPQELMFVLLIIGLRDWKKSVFVRQKEETLLLKEFQLGVNPEMKVHRTQFVGSKFICSADSQHAQNSAISTVRRQSQLSVNSSLIRKQLLTEPQGDIILRPRASLFHLIRKIVLILEQFRLMHSPSQESVSEVISSSKIWCTDLFSGCPMDLQLAYAEDTLDWVFDLFLAEANVDILINLAQSQAWSYLANCSLHFARHTNDSANSAFHYLVLRSLVSQFICRVPRSPQQMAPASMDSAGDRPLEIPASIASESKKYTTSGSSVLGSPVDGKQLLAGAKTVGDEADNTVSDNSMAFEIAKCIRSLRLEIIRVCIKLTEKLKMEQEASSVSIVQRIAAASIHKHEDNGGNTDVIEDAKEDGPEEYDEVEMLRFGCMIKKQKEKSGRQTNNIFVVVENEEDKQIQRFLKSASCADSTERRALSAFFGAIDGRNVGEWDAIDMHSLLGALEIFDNKSLASDIVWYLLRDMEYNGTGQVNECQLVEFVLRDDPDDVCPASNGVMCWKLHEYLDEIVENAPVVDNADANDREIESINYQDGRSRYEFLMELFIQMAYQNCSQVEIGLLSNLNWCFESSAELFLDQIVEGFRILGTNKLFAEGSLDRFLERFAGSSNPEGVRKYRWVSLLNWIAVDCKLETNVGTIRNLSQRLFPIVHIETVAEPNETCMKQDLDEIIFSTPSPLSIDVTSSPRGLPSPRSNLFNVVDMNDSLERADDNAVVHFDKDDSQAADIASNRIAASQSNEILWNVPEEVTAGTEVASLLSARAVTRLACTDTVTQDIPDLVAEIPGQYYYNHSPDEMLTAGKHILKVLFCSSDFSCIMEKEVAVAAVKAVPRLIWEVPREHCLLLVGDELTANQLNCRCADGVEGSFFYSKGEGQVMSREGEEMLTVTFVPERYDVYAQQTASMTFTVGSKTRKAIRMVGECGIPEEGVHYGRNIVDSGGIHCQAFHSDDDTVASGVLTFAPALDSILPVGQHTVVASFVPENSDQYLTAHKEFNIRILKTSLFLDWPEPARSVFVGETLSDVLQTPIVKGDNKVNVELFYSIPLSHIVAVSDGELITMTVTAVPIGNDTTNYNITTDTRTITVSRQKKASIEWNSPDSFFFGTVLSATQLNAAVYCEDGSQVPQGNFEYDPPIGTRLAVGHHQLSVTFHPQENMKYESVSQKTSVHVKRWVPPIEWLPEVSTISLDAITIPDNCLNAICTDASITGKFQYFIAAEVAIASSSSKKSVTAIFVPDDGDNYETMRKVVDFEVMAPVQVTIDWELSSTSIEFGVELTAEQLCATVFVENNGSQPPGSIVYDPPLGTKLEAGRHLLYATYYPDDPHRYCSTKKTLTIVVTKAVPRLIWEVPREHCLLLVGDELTANQLNCRCVDGVEGSFFYSKGEGQVMSREGEEMLTVTFVPRTPFDNNYSLATASMILEIVSHPLQKFKANNSKPAMLRIDWSGYKNIEFGDSISTSNVLSARCYLSHDYTEVPGRFDFIPKPGTNLNAGRHIVKAFFVAEDVDLGTCDSVLEIFVAKRQPLVEWPAGPIVSPVGGDIVVPSVGSNVEGRTFIAVDNENCPGLQFTTPGKRELRLTFYPDDSDNFEIASQIVELDIRPAKKMAQSRIIWNQPAPIRYGQPLSSKELNAVALTNSPNPNLFGTVVFDPAIGAVLDAGIHKLRAKFEPNEPLLLQGCEAHIELIVSKAVPRLIWEVPREHCLLLVGDELTANQLNCRCADGVEGSFFYSKGEGQVMSREGVEMLTVTFVPRTPFDNNYSLATASKSLTIQPRSLEKIIITWEVNDIDFGTAIGDSQLCALARGFKSNKRVSGDYNYSVHCGAILSAGRHQLQVQFVPEQNLRYPIAEHSVVLNVRKRLPRIIWEPELPIISLNQFLSSQQLNAIAIHEDYESTGEDRVLAGTMEYSPALGEGFDSEGVHTISVRFIPNAESSLDYLEATKSISVYVYKVQPKLVVTVAYDNDSQDPSVDTEEVVLADSMRALSPTRPRSSSGKHSFRSPRHPHRLHDAGNSTRDMDQQVQSGEYRFLIDPKTLSASHAIYPQSDEMDGLDRDVASEMQRQPHAKMLPWIEPEQPLVIAERPRTTGGSRKSIKKSTDTNHLKPQRSLLKRRIAFEEIVITSYLMRQSVDAPNVRMSCFGSNFNGQTTLQGSNNQCRCIFTNCQHVLLPAQWDSDVVRVSIRGLAAVAGEAEVEYYCSVALPLQQLRDLPPGKLNFQVIAFPKLFSNVLGTAIDDKPLLQQCKLKIQFVVNIGMESC